jgi:hypothetical protein
MFDSDTASRFGRRSFDEAERHVVAASAGSNATTIANDAVTNARLPEQLPG